MLRKKSGWLLLASLLLFITVEVQAGSGKTRSTVELAGRSYREDVNGDGKVNLADVVSILLVAGRGRNSTEADYDGNGVCDMRDALVLVKSLFGGISQPLDPRYDHWSLVGPGGGGAMFIPHVSPLDPDNVVLRCDMTGSYASLDAGANWKMYNLRSVVEDFAFDPNRAHTVYAASTGLYRSEDGGMSWSLLYPSPAEVLEEDMVGDHAEQWFVTADGMPDQPVTHILVDPADSDHLWLTLSWSWSSAVAELLVSHDRGASWQTIKKDIAGPVVNILPGAWWGKPDEVMVATAGLLFRINDQAQDYELLTLPDNPITAIEGGADSSGVVLYCMSDFRLSGSLLFGGVYRSMDGGHVWRTVKNELAADWSPGSSLVPQLTSLAVCETQPSVAYVGCGNSGNSYNFGIFKTVDRGDKWSWVLRHAGNSLTSNNYTGAWMTEYYGPAWAGAPIGMGVGPNDPNIVYCTDYGRAYHTLDGGKTWQQVYSHIQPDGAYSSTGLNVTSVYDLAFDPGDSLHLATPSTDIGLWHSHDGGGSWVMANRGVPDNWINTCYWVAFDPEVKNRAWGGWSNCHDLPRLKMFTSGTLEAGGYAGGVTVSDDGLNNWRVSGVGIPANAICTHIILDPSSPATARTLYVAAFGQGVYKSVDGGKTWNLKASGLGQNKYCWRLNLLPDGTLFLLVSRGMIKGQTVGGGLYRSDNAGESWQKVALPGQADAPNDLVACPVNPERLYLSLWPVEDRTVYPRISRDGGLLLSQDGGRTWSRIFREDANVYAAAVDPTQPSRVALSTFDSAAFLSQDYGITWNRIQGFTFKWGYRPVFDIHHPGMLYLTTFGGGVHYGPVTGVPGSEEIVNFSDQWRWGH